MMQHLTGQKNDKFLSVNCRRGFQDPGRASRKHIGTFPAHLQQFVGETHFPCFLDLLLQELALRQGPAGQPPQAVHVLMWCNDGTHLSVSASRVVEVAAAALGIPCPSCTSTSPPHPTCGVLRNQHFRRCVCFNRSDVKIQSLAILLRCVPTCHLSAHQWLLRGTCNMCSDCAGQAEQETPWARKVVALVGRG